VSTREVREVPFFRPSVTRAEIDEVVDTLRSGWLTTGPGSSGSRRSSRPPSAPATAVALNSATAALHLAVEALGLEPGDAVLVPTMTFAATAEVVPLSRRAPDPRRTAIR
jgi:perosamine synthetase